MEDPKKKTIVTITGKDKPGITSVLTDILNQEGVGLLDLEQSVTYGQLSLSMVLEFNYKINYDTIIKDLLFKTKELDLNMDYKSINGETLLRAPSSQFVVTLLASKILPKHISSVAKVLAEQSVNIDSIRKLNERGLSCVEMILYTNSKIDLNQLKTNLLKISTSQPSLDIAVQKENLYRRAKHLVVMDMDSTLIQIEVIDELAKLYGVGKEVSAITEKAMAGEIDFDESLKQRVALLEGLPEKLLHEFADRIPLTDGAEILIHTLKKLGYKIALISGGFSLFGKKLQSKLGLHYVYTNVLQIKDGKLTGLVEGPIVNAQRKADLLEMIAQQEGIPLESTIAIGDGANDILMLKKAGLGVAFNAKAKTREAASASINQKTLASILYLLGITDQDVANV